ARRPGKATVRRGQETAPRRRGVRAKKDGPPGEGRGVGSGRRQRRAAAAQTGRRAGEAAEAGPLRAVRRGAGNAAGGESHGQSEGRDRKSTRLNSSHEWISYAIFCL